MKGDKTFSIIKPNAVKNGHIGEILADITRAGFKIDALKMQKLSKSKVRAFYSVHKDKPFFKDLVDFMYSGPIVTMILEKENAVEEYRKLIGSTDPKEAAEGTIRKKYGESKQNNAVHGSDSDENAIIESNFFFSFSERFNGEGSEELH